MNTKTVPDFAVTHKYTKEQSHRPETVDKLVCTSNKDRRVCTSNKDRREKFTKRMAEVSGDMEQKKRRTEAVKSKSKSMNLEKEDTTADAKGHKEDASNHLTSTPQEPLVSKASSIENARQIDTKKMAASIKRIDCVKGVCLMGLNESAGPTKKFKCKTNPSRYKQDDSDVEPNVKEPRLESRRRGYDDVDDYTTTTRLEARSVRYAEMDPMLRESMLEARRQEYADVEYADADSGSKEVKLAMRREKYADMDSKVRESKLAARKRTAQVLPPASGGGTYYDVLGVRKDATDQDTKKTDQKMPYERRGYMSKSLWMGLCRPHQPAQKTTTPRR